MPLADRLKEAMKGPPAITAAELARACGVKQPSVSDWLSGRTKQLRGANLHRAAAKLGVSVIWLAEGRGPMKAREGEQAPALFEDKLSQRGQRIVHRLVDAEAARAASENVYRIIEHALALGMGKPAQDADVEPTPEEKADIVALYEKLPPHRREALLVFIKNWIGD